MIKSISQVQQSNVPIRQARKRPIKKSFLQKSSDELSNMQPLTQEPLIMGHPVISQSKNLQEKFVCNQKSSKIVRQPFGNKKQKHIGLNRQVQQDLQDIVADESIPVFAGDQPDDTALGTSKLLHWKLNCPISNNSLCNRFAGFDDVVEFPGLLDDLAFISSSSEMFIDSGFDLSDLVISVIREENVVVDSLKQTTIDEDTSTINSDTTVDADIFNDSDNIDGFEMI